MSVTTEARDQELICPECDAPFARSITEQRYYDGRSLAPPATCPTCRARQRAKRNAELLSAHQAVDTLATRGGVPVFGGAGGGFGGGRPNGGGRHDGPRRLHRATCTACGQSTEVPFEPRRDRPVYCRACFNARNGR